MKTSIALAGIVMAGASIVSAQAINGAGATFPYPIYGKWFEEFRKKNPSIEINYQSKGSGAGIAQLTEGTVDFGASDMPMKDEQIAALKVKALHFPTVLGGVVPTFNVPGVSELQFSSEMMAGIFLGKITKWNDSKIAKANPGVKLPATDIVVVHRSDGSGTTFVFTDYLSKISPDWKAGPGANTSIKWPTGVGQQGNEGVAGMVKQTSGAVGYVELIYALQNKMNYGSVQNAAGVYLKANLDSVTAAAASAAKNMPADFRVSITNAPGKNAYPIASFTWLLIPTRIEDAKKRTALVSFLKWMLADGQKDCAALGYAPLPKEVVARELKQIAQIH
ncbi:MAG TPA: phosphate ABC transporter substrate-binding protein PstS [Bryobacteraceae bacterium]|jgi:phosphate transport system substrate-binding protein